MTTDRFGEIHARLENVRAELDAIEVIAHDMWAEAEAERRHAARVGMGEVLGATKLAAYLGFSRTYASTLMRSELAGFTWSDRAGRLRVNRRDVDAWLTAKAAPSG